MVLMTENKKWCENPPHHFRTTFSGAKKHVILNYFNMLAGRDERI